MTRKVCNYLLLHPEDCEAPHGLDLSPGSRDSTKVHWLTEAFSRRGFDHTEPALVGYPLDGKVQLLSGTHRLEAAKRAGIRIPVMMRLRSEVEAAWGTEKWNSLINDIPVKDLELVEIPEGGEIPNLDDRVDPHNFQIV